jgi:hypothetical protein
MKTQFAINSDLIDSLPVGAFFQKLSKPGASRFGLGGPRLIGRYVVVGRKHGVPLIQSVGDGRQWLVSETDCLAPHVLIEVEQWSLQGVK